MQWKCEVFLSLQSKELYQGQRLNTLYCPAKFKGKEIRRNCKVIYITLIKVTVEVGVLKGILEILAEATIIQLKTVLAVTTVTSTVQWSRLLHENSTFLQPMNKLLVAYG